MVDGRMLTYDPLFSDITVPLAVLRAFVPHDESGGEKAIFVDGNRENIRLANLRWETTGDRVARAIAMADGSTSRWAPAFAEFWRGDQQALNDFFKEMRHLVLSAYKKKEENWRYYHPLEPWEYAANTLYKMFVSIRRGSLTSLDNLGSWALTIGASVLRDHHRYAIRLIGLESSGDDESTFIVADSIGWTMPSAETCALANEEILYRNAAANRALPGAL